MKHLIMLICLCVLVSASSFAQQEKMTPEDKQEKNAAREARIAKKNDYAIFHRQLLALKEYADEKKRIPSLQKTTKEPVKVLAVIDSNDNDDEDSKTLIGYIRQDVGDNSTNMYEITYDKAAKKIISVKRTPEAADADKEAAEDKDDIAAEKAAKKASAKKSKEDDDNDPDDKPSKTKKDKDDD